jgi:hypothetical protein
MIIKTWYNTGRIELCLSWSLQIKAGVNLCGSSMIRGDVDGDPPYDTDVPLGGLSPHDRPRRNIPQAVRQVV